MVSRKLKDNSGASLMLALLFFLLCALAGSVVLAAGTAAAGRMKEVEATEQAYFTVMSAAKLIRDEVNGKSLIYAYDETNSQWIQEPGGALNKLLKEYVEETAKYPNEGTAAQPPATKELTIEPQNTDDKKAMGTVNAEFSMIYTDSNPAEQKPEQKSEQKPEQKYEKFTIVVTLSLAAEGKDPGYSCTLTIPASLLNNGAAAGTEGGAGRTLSLIWSNPVITRGN